MRFACIALFVALASTSTSLEISQNDSNLKFESETDIEIIEVEAEPDFEPDVNFDPDFDSDFGFNPLWESEYEKFLKYKQPILINEGLVDPAQRRVFMVVNEEDENCERSQKRVKTEPHPMTKCVVFTSQVVHIGNRTVHENPFGNYGKIPLFRALTVEASFAPKSNDSSVECFPENCKSYPRLSQEEMFEGVPEGGRLVPLSPYHFSLVEADRGFDRFYRSMKNGWTVYIPEDEVRTAGDGFFTKHSFELTF